MTVADIASGRRDESVQLRRAACAGTIDAAVTRCDLLLRRIVTGPVFAKPSFPKSDPLAGVREAAAFFYRVASHAPDRRGNFWTLWRSRSSGGASCGVADHRQRRLYRVEHA